MLLQTEQTQIRQLLQDLPDQGLLCLLLKYDVSDPTLVELTNNFFAPCTNMEVNLYNNS